MKTITFYSYKGGVGRSLALSNIAIRLSEFKKKVCILDFDLEAPGLHFKFHNYTLESINKGIVDYIYEFSEKGKIPSKIKDYANTLKPSNTLFEPINFISAGNIDGSNYWKKLSKIKWSDMFYSDLGEGVKFFLDLKRKVLEEFKPDFFLIDSKTGITDISGITLKILADEVVILAANNRENLFGSKKIINSLMIDSNTLSGKVPKINFIITRIPFTDSIKDKGTEISYIDRIKKEIEIDTNISNLEILVIHSDRRLEENERTLIGDEYEHNKVSISNDYLKLFDRLTSDVLQPDEIQLFKDKKAAEKEYNKALLEKDNLKKISYLNNAIQLDATIYEYYLLRGACFLNIGDFQKAYNDLNQTIILNPNSSSALLNLGFAYYKQDNYDEAERFLNEAIQKNANERTAYTLKANIYKKQEKYNEALNLYNLYLNNVSPDDSDFLNSRADLNRFLGNYTEAYKDIFKAIELDSSNPIYYGTLAEIYASTNRMEEFYLNLTIALTKGINQENMKFAKDVYSRLINDKRMLEILSKYNIDVTELV